MDISNVQFNEQHIFSVSKYIYYTYDKVTCQLINVLSEIKRSITNFKLKF